MRDKEARENILKMQNQINELAKECFGYSGSEWLPGIGKYLNGWPLVQRIENILENFNALMTHLNLEFEDIKPGVRVRKKK